MNRIRCFMIEPAGCAALSLRRYASDGTGCGAGAGSIQAGSYHGFLRNGYLEEC